MSSVPQNSFSAGEWSPTLWSRQDIKQYLMAARKMRNIFPAYWGSAHFRPGTTLVNHTKADGTARLVPFNFNDELHQNYILEFGNLYIRFHAQGSTVPDPNNGAIPYEIVAPYLAADLFRLKFTQVGDIITVTHPKYPVMELKRFGHQNWTISAAVFEPSLIIVKEGIKFTENPDQAGDAQHPPKPWQYVVVSRMNDGTISQPSPILQAATPSRKLVRGTDRATIKIAWDVPGIGQPAFRMPTFDIYAGRGGLFGYIGTSDVPSFEDDGRDPDYEIPPPPYVSKSLTLFGIPQWTYGTNYSVGDRVVNQNKIYECILAGCSHPSNVNAGPTTTAADIADGISTLWQNATAYAYQSYVVSAGNVYICVTPGNSAAAPAGGPYTMPGLDPGTGTYPKITDGTVEWQWTGRQGSAIHWKYIGTKDDFQTDRYPSCSAMFDLRRVLAGSKLNPATLFFSKVNFFGYFHRPEFPVDNSPLEFGLASLRGEQIRNMLTMQNLLVFTSMGEWMVSGAGSGDPIGPTSIRTRPLSYHGSSWISPLTIGDVVLYIQAKGNVVRDLTFSSERGGYSGKDLTLFTKHIFSGKTIVDWAYCEDPYGLIWVVLSDGTMASLTYVPDLDVWGWARHDTDGLVKSVASVPEGDEDVLYMVVQRNGFNLIERMSTTKVPDPKEAIYLDSAKTYRGALATQVTGLGHLNGKTVTANADGFEVKDLVVAGGTISIADQIPDGAGVIHVGLPYTGDLELLDVAHQNNRPVVVSDIWFSFTASRGLWFGETLDEITKFVEWRQRNVSMGYDAIPLQTGKQNVTITARWGATGRAAMQIRSPYPVTITGVSREVKGEGRL